MIILRGAPLSAHTWASKPKQQGIFFGLSSTPKASFFAFRMEIIAQKYAFVDKLKRIFSKIWHCLLIADVILL